MRVEKRGDGEPEYTVVGSVHGDEPAGRNAIEKVLDEGLEFRKPVQFIVANEKALAEDTRYTECDLNRNFPGNPESEMYEERLAAEILDQVKGTKLLDIHTTHSYPQPFGTFSNLNDTTRDLLRSTGVKNAVYFPEDTGTLNEQLDAVVVETGYQKTDQAEANAVGVIKNFLAAQGVIDGKFETSDPDVFKYQDTVEGDWEFTAENFKQVRAGESFAERNGDKLVAKEDFYPVLMSTNGYDGQLGFKAEKIEKLTG
ncbi:MAG: succinylglutamate desuccinylase/aspartoacylase family protein [Candidatus Nanohalobium sp.]